MEKITMIGTGSAMVTKCFNTCFTLSRDEEHFLVDTGGGNTVLSNLEKAEISIANIHNVFISHSHNDHITGIIWIIRAVAQQILNEKYQGNLYIYCHKQNVNIIETVSHLLLQKKFTDFIGKRIFFKEIEDGAEAEILGLKTVFFDIRSDKHLQFGFRTELSNGKTLTFLGDEPYRKEVHDYAKEVDYLMHEAFCLYSEREVFKPYEKFHSTVKDACENAKELNVKTIILYHTEDKNLTNRKKSYEIEGKQYFSGSIVVPDDLEVIKL